eukprot:NODE_415_length_9032_cov_0.580992.p3 type:complete len:332 gc:universal NODE_415_length_9032_cov_0.580992:6862-5867(-)
MLFTLISAFGPVRNDGQCGALVGSAACSAGNCCSTFGWCGSTEAHCKSSCSYQCDGLTPPNATQTSAEVGVRGDGQCGYYFNGATCPPGNCCSIYGFCGNTDLHCQWSSCASQCRDPTSSECPLVIELAKGLHMDILHPEKFAKVRANCCTASDVGLGTVCTNGKVTAIDWRSLQLDGSIKGQFLPPTLTFLSLYQNEITGTIPANLPATLWYLQVNSNKLTGSIPSTLPLGLTDFYMNENLLTGTLPEFPASMQHLSISFSSDSATTKNQITGVLKLHKPAYIYVVGQLITDIIVDDNSTLVDCDISKNPLLSNSSHLENLSMCRQTGLY